MEKRKKEMNEIIDTLNHDVSKVSQNYLNHPIRAAVVAIPIIGSSIDVIISVQGQKFQQKRLEQFVTEVANQTKYLDENKVDKSFLQSEEFFDILLTGYDKCFRTRHIEKIRLNAQILVGSVLTDNKDNREFTEDFLNAVANLHPIDLKLAKLIYDQQKVELPRFNDEYQELQFVNERGWKELLLQSKLDKIEFEIRLKNLETAGLIRGIIGSYVGYFGGKYIITDLFRKLMDFIKYSKNPLFSSKFG